jgi:hypothetical protein
MNGIDAYHSIPWQRLAEGHTALSWWKFMQRDWRGAEHHNGTAAIAHR